MFILVYYAKGFADNIFEKEFVGVVKVVIWSVLFWEDMSFVVENFFENKVNWKRVFKEVLNKKEKKRRLDRIYEEEMARWELEEDFVIMGKDEFFEV